MSAQADKLGRRMLADLNRAYAAAAPDQPTPAQHAAAFTAAIQSLARAATAGGQQGAQVTHMGIAGAFGWLLSMCPMANRGALIAEFVQLTEIACETYEGQAADGGTTLQ